MNAVISASRLAFVRVDRHSSQQKRTDFMIVKIWRLGVGIKAIDWIVGFGRSISLRSGRAVGGFPSDMLLIRHHHLG